MTTQEGSQFREGYLAARRFYGDGARYALEQVAREVERLRVTFPLLPAAAEVHVSRIEALVSQETSAGFGVCGVDD